ncbi:MAG: glutathione S-transferase family protein [Dongiaceae bacterium]
MIDLYTYGTSNGQRASIMLEECGLTHTPHKIDLDKGDQKAPEFLKLNPQGQIPVIVDHDRPGGKPLTLCQSGAIMLYLSEKAGKFMPRDATRRALAQQWFMQVMTDIAPSSAALFVATNVLLEAPAAVRGFFQQRLMNHFRSCNRRLEEVEFLAAELSIADLALYPTVATRWDMIEQSGELPHLVRWASAVASRPGVQRGMMVPD